MALFFEPRNVIKNGNHRVLLSRDTGCETLRFRSSADVSHKFTSIHPSSDFLLSLPLRLHYVFMTHDFPFFQQRSTFLTL